MATTKNTLSVTTPVGRLISGSVTIPNKLDYEGNVKTVKTGPNAGQPRPTIDFGVAYPKTPGHTSWKTDPALGLVNGASAAWLPAIAAFGAAEDPQSARADFSWKILDGDDVVPNRKGKKNAEKDGWPGHWVVMFSNSSAPKTVDYLHSKGDVIDGDLIKRGYFVQVMAEYQSNQPSATAGLYANHRAVALIAYGPVMTGGDVDTEKAGFGQGVALPPGATTAPPAAVPGSAAPAPAPAPAPVAPARDLVAPPAPALTAKAAAEQPGVTYAAFLTAGWTEQNLRESGYIA